MTPEQRLDSAILRLRSAVESAEYLEANTALLDFGAAAGELWHSLPADSAAAHELRDRIGGLLHWVAHMAASDRAHCVLTLTSLPNPGAYAGRETNTGCWRLDA